MSILKKEFSLLFRFIEEDKVAIKYIPYHRSIYIKIPSSGSLQEIHYCPWTGKKLPKSLSDEYFDQLDKLGIDSENLDEIPEEMKSEEWWIRLGL
ncbi:MAG: hypothetical protein MRY59_13540 [Aquisalinus sp.]|nr:hypothetical protein [Aquisalinus sp.]